MGLAVYLPALTPHNVLCLLTAVLTTKGVKNKSLEIKSSYQIARGPLT